MTPNDVQKFYTLRLSLSYADQMLLQLVTSLKQVQFSSSRLLMRLSACTVVPGVTKYN